MPQRRQRIVFCDCLDCEQQQPGDLPSTSSPAGEAAARQEPPPKCLLVVLSGALRDDGGGPSSGSSSTSLPHLHRAAAQGGLCLLTVRDGTADGCSELAQLLGVHEEWQQGASDSLPSLADRFKDMVSSFASNSPAVQQLAAAVGMSSSAVLDPAPLQDGIAAPLAAGGEAAAQGGAAGFLGALMAGGAGGQQQQRRQQHEAASEPDKAAAAAAAAAAAVAAQLPDPQEAARRILAELGLQQADAGLDLLMLHVDANSMAAEQHQHEHAGSADDDGLQDDATAAAVLAWLDRTLRYLNNSSAFKDAVLLTVLATPGAHSLAAVPPLLAADAAAGTPINASARVQGVVAEQQEQRVVLKPLQSWQQLAGQPLAIAARRPLLCLRRLPGVVRRDGCQRFSLSECCARTDTLAILADRLLPEVAYKLGRAPKYGA